MPTSETSGESVAPKEDAAGAWGAVVLSLAVALALALFLAFVLLWRIVFVRHPGQFLLSSEPEDGKPFTSVSFDEAEAAEAEERGGRSSKRLPRSVFGSRHAVGDDSGDVELEIVWDGQKQRTSSEPVFSPMVGGHGTSKGFAAVASDDRDEPPPAHTSHPLTAMTRLTAARPKDEDRQSLRADEEGGEGDDEQPFVAAGGGSQGGSARMRADML